jgi:hypothetical protein
MSRIYSWACRVALDAKGRYHVIPCNRPDCEGVGRSVEEAKAAAARAMAVELNAAAGLVLPPAQMLDPHDIERGDVVRLEIEIPD